MTTINLDGASGYLTRAKSQRAGVLMLPTIFGVNPFMKDYAASLATIGLTSLVWDPYPDQKLPANFDEAVTRGGQLRDQPSLDAMAICVDFLMGELRLDAVGTMGWCLGGRYCLLLAAREQRIGAVASIYPTIHSPREANQDEDVVSRAGEIACPVQLVYPGSDHLTSNETFQRLQQNLQRRDAGTVVQLYPKAGHGFWHNHEPENEIATKRTKPLVAAFLEAVLT
jgi:carboxymethylenebutenolidase